MKLKAIGKFLWLILFTLVHLWFMVFNWPLFTTMLNVNLGFGVVRLPPFLILFLTGFVMFGIQSWTGYVNYLHQVINNLEEEIARRNRDRQNLNSKRPGPNVNSAAMTGPAKDGTAREVARKEHPGEGSAGQGNKSKDLFF